MTQKIDHRLLDEEEDDENDCEEFEEDGINLADTQRLQDYDDQFHSPSAQTHFNGIPA